MSRMGNMHFNAMFAGTPVPALYAELAVGIAALVDDEPAPIPLEDGDPGAVAREHPGWGARGLRD